MCQLLHPWVLSLETWTSWESRGTLILTRDQIGWQGHHPGEYRDPRGICLVLLLAAFWFCLFLVFHMSCFINNKGLAGTWCMVSVNAVLRGYRSLPFEEDWLKLPMFIVISHPFVRRMDSLTSYSPWAVVPAAFVKGGIRLHGFPVWEQCVRVIVRNWWQVSLREGLQHTPPPTLQWESHRGLFIMALKSLWAQETQVRNNSPVDGDAGGLGQGHMRSSQRQEFPSLQDPFCLLENLPCAVLFEHKRQAETDSISCLTDR